MGGKHEAFVRCSCSEENAVFTTGGRHLYHALPMSDMEKRILSLAKFVMSYQKAYVEHAFGSDYKVTWDANCTIIYRSKPPHLTVTMAYLK
jgi:hypothetical protein